MARRKRRKSAGPPPAPQQKRAEERRATAAPRRRSGEPHPPSFQGVVIRAVLVAVLFYPYLIFIAGESSATATIISAIAFVVMLPLGMLLDRWRYRIQMRRWQQGQGGR